MKNTFILILLFQITPLAFAQNPRSVNNKYKINSKALDETREIWVNLPANYDSTKSYPTMYVLDAEWQFDIAFAIMEELAVNDKIPKHIVIGIPHIDYDHRFKDLTFTNTEYNSSGEPDSTAAFYFNKEKTQGGLKFLEYLTNEVVPFVDSLHITNGFDVLIGHSLSGYFGAYILTTENPFNAFQLYDPSIWYNKADPVTHLTETVSKSVKANVFISTANGGKDREQYNVDMHKKFHEILLQNNINSELKVYDYESHGTVRLPSLIDGLSSLYKGFSIGYISPTDTITVEDAQKHFQSFSNKVNYNFNPPVEAFRWIGHANHFQKNWAEAIKAYQLCAALYNTDVIMLTEFADAYFQTNNLHASLETYQKALAIDPTNKLIQSKIEELIQLIAKEN